MATRCIDISENRKITSMSPIAIFVFIPVFIILTALIEFGFTYFLLVFVSFVLIQIFFQYTPRYIFLTIRFLLTNAYLTPSFSDEKYVADEKKISSLNKVLEDTYSEEY